MTVPLECVYHKGMVNNPEKPCARCQTSQREISSYCRPCHNLNGRESRQRNGGSRNYHLQRRYGITEEEYNQMLAAQDNKCAICGKDSPTHLDHKHVGKSEKGTKEEVRGILCVPCNNGIGLFRDSPDLLRAAAKYLEGDGE